MQSWLMLISWPSASALSDSCRLSGIRTVITRMASRDGSRSVARRRSSESICLISAYSSVRSKAAMASGVS
ncbi:MAG: hypothetical protein SGJ19_28870 [Planctomycetia bacterium]|nr:hypothetical protein [Planctomycetia bacterium]